MFARGERVRSTCEQERTNPSERTEGPKALECPIKSCNGEIRPNILHPYHDKIEFVMCEYVSAYICGECTRESFICRVCGEQFPCKRKEDYRGAILRHLTKHNTHIDIHNRYIPIYLRFIAASGKWTCDPTRITNYELANDAIVVDVWELSKHIPYFICLGKINYGELVSEVLMKCEPEKSNFYGGEILNKLIYEDSLDYLIHLLQIGYQSDGYECIICGGEFDCMPTAEIYDLHSKTHTTSCVNLPPYYECDAEYMLRATRERNLIDVLNWMRDAVRDREKNMQLKADSRKIINAAIVTRGHNK